VRRGVGTLVGVVVLACLTGLLAQEQGLKIVVIAGEDSVNIIDRKTAVAPVVEVRDRNDLPVAGVLVRFTIDGKAAAFQNGLQTVSVTTNTVGRAAVAQLNPLSSGAIQIQVQASYQGQVATATIQQANFTTAAEAAQAGRTASQGASSGSPGSGGMSTAAKVGLIGGAAAGAAAGGLALSQSGGDGGRGNSPPAISGITSNTTIGLQSATVMSFSSRAGDPDGDPLTYQWNFGDGETATGDQVSHVYQSSGVFTVTLTASDGQASATSQTSVTIRNVTGRWVGRVICPPGRCAGGATEFAITIDAVQSGTNVSGSSSQQFPGSPPDRCTFSNGRVADARLVSFAQFQGCAVVNLFLGCVGGLDSALDRFSAGVLPPETAQCELSRQ
jgi:hypothetical protein